MQITTATSQSTEHIAQSFGGHCSFYCSGGPPTLQNGNRSSTSNSESPISANCMYSRVIEKGVALTGRNTTGPPCSRGAIIRLKVAWCHRMACAGAAACRPAVECCRRQTPTTITSRAPYTMCRPASNKIINFYVSFLLKRSYCQIHIYTDKCI